MFLFLDSYRMDFLNVEIFIFFQAKIYYEFCEIEIFCPNERNHYYIILHHILYFFPLTNMLFSFKSFILVHVYFLVLVTFHYQHWFLILTSDRMLLSIFSQKRIMSTKEFAKQFIIKQIIIHQLMEISTDTSSYTVDHL